MDTQFDDGAPIGSLTDFPTIRDVQTTSTQLLFPTRCVVENSKADLLSMNSPISGKLSRSSD